MNGTSRTRAETLLQTEQRMLLQPGVVKCYLCGSIYDLTDEATARHTSHAKKLGSYPAGQDILMAKLDACQRERDTALKAAR